MWYLERLALIRQCREIMAGYNVTVLCWCDQGPSNGCSAGTGCLRLPNKGRWYFCIHANQGSIRGYWTPKSRLKTQFTVHHTYWNTGPHHCDLLSPVSEREIERLKDWEPTLFYFKIQRHENRSSSWLACVPPSHCAFSSAPCPLTFPPKAGWTALRTFPRASALDLSSHTDPLLPLLCGATLRIDAPYIGRRLGTGGSQPCTAFRCGKR